MAEVVGANIVERESDEMMGRALKPCFNRTRDRQGVIHPDAKTKHRKEAHHRVKVWSTRPASDRIKPW